MKPRYFYHKGMEKFPLEADDVGVVDDNGNDIELMYRRSDKEVSLSCDNKIVILPQASNVVRLEVRK